MAGLTLGLVMMGMTALVIAQPPSGGPRGRRADAGGGVDAGAGVDAGWGVVDAGVGGADARFGLDGGIGMEAGLPMDAGLPMLDASMLGTEAGTRPMDSGRPVSPSGAPNPSGTGGTRRSP